MKKLLLFLIVVLGLQTVQAQVNDFVPYRSKVRYIGMGSDSSLYIPMRDTNFVPFNLGFMTRRPQDSIIYVAIKITAGGKHWDKLGNWMGVATSSGTWGSITGTLSAQTDLQSALDGKVPTSRTITINGTTYDLSTNRSWTISGGGGSQNLQQTTDLGDSTTGRLVTNDTAKAQDLYVHGSGYYGDTLYDRGDSLIAFGSSITAGSGVSSSQRFSYLLAQTYGMIEANYGGGGNTIDAVYNSLYRIPTKTSNRGFLLFEYNMNDCTTSDTTTWKTKANVIIDTSIARGWSVNEIGFVGGPYSNAAARVNLPNWVRATRTIGETRGVKFFDAYTFMASRGGVALTQDSVHPNALGHYIIAQAAKPAFLRFKKKGLIDVTGDVIARRRFFAGPPPASSKYPVNSVFVANNKAQFIYDVYIGDTVRKGNAGMLNISTSTNQTGIGIKDNGNNTTTDVSGGVISLYNSSGQALKLYPTSITVGNGDLTFTGSGGANLFYLSTYGSAIFNNAGNAANFRFAGDNQTNLFYIDGTNDRIGVRTATPDSGMTVLSSVRLGSTVRLSGLPTGKQAYQIYSDVNGTLYRGDSTVGGGGSGGGMTNPMTTTGDIIYSSSGSTPARLAVGAENYVLLSNGTTPYWGPVPGGSSAVYVDTMFINGSLDSLIWKKNGNRYAIKYPTSGSSGWALAGNSTTGGWTEGDFLGTTNNRQLLIRTNNIIRARIDSNGTAGTFRLYPGTSTSVYLDYGLANANKWTLASGGAFFDFTADLSIRSNAVNSFAVYNGGVTAGSGSGASNTILQIDNASSTKSALRLTSTIKKTTAADGDITRDANGLYYGKSTTWNEILMTASVNSVSPTSPNRTITVVIGGTTYYIAAKTTND